MRDTPVFSLSEALLFRKGQLLKVLRSKSQHSMEKVDWEASTCLWNSKHMSPGQTEFNKGRDSNSKKSLDFEDRDRNLGLSGDYYVSFYI